jgi:beta-lactamase superfamily II metal-dependent hydrolase
MNCEIEFLPVGDASKAGDAIVVRYGEVGAYQLMIVDGGNVESGKELVTHIRSQFGYNSVIEHVVLTHSDTDHASGLREVLAEFPVRNLWLHMPWTFAGESRPFFANKSWTDDGLEKALRNEYSLIDELVTLAIEKNITVQQPFAGATIGPFRVLSPFRGVYPRLIPQFDRTAAPDQAAIEAVNCWIGKQPNALAKFIANIVEKIQNLTTETWGNERLKDGGVTSATNETSVVLYGECSAGKVLLTGDAGYWGLSMAAHYAEQSGLALQNFDFVQIPHHGSRRNVGPTILNHLLGPIRLESAARTSLALVSSPKDDATHPRKMVLNAFLRRGFNWSATQGVKKVYWGGFPPRPGYSGLPPAMFHTQVEDYD